MNTHLDSVHGCRPILEQRSPHTNQASFPYHSQDKADQHQLNAFPHFNRLQLPTEIFFNGFLQFSLPSSQWRKLLLPQMYKTGALESSRACMSGLTMLSRHPELRDASFLRSGHPPFELAAYSVYWQAAVPVGTFPAGDDTRANTLATLSPSTASPISPSLVSPVSAVQTWAPINAVTNQGDVNEVANTIRSLATVDSGDRPLLLEVLDRVSTTDATAQESIRVLIHDFQHGSEDVQFSAARLWAILLRNSSAAFVRQSTSADFLEVIKSLVLSNETSAEVRNMVLRILGDFFYSNPTCESLRILWRTVKPNDEPDRGSLSNTHDAVLGPSGHFHPPMVPSILDRANPPIPQARVDTRFPDSWEAPQPGEPSSCASSSLKSASQDVDLESEPSESTLYPQTSDIGLNQALVQAENRSNIGAVASSSQIPIGVAAPYNEVIPHNKGIYPRTLLFLRGVASRNTHPG
ncbi:hypothetical protein C8R44DRAFT_973798 [Mycena epipterygia]|nr:hypothetical protein C8R44DRAFT_973798 [Mycena epipterygia]